MLKRIAIFLSLITLASFSVAAESNIRTLKKPVAVSTPTGKIEVREFFWYGCSHCFKLEPFIAAWLKTKPKDVVFIRTPGALNLSWETHARGYYAAEAIGIADKAHASLFDSIHIGRQQLFDQASLAKFYSNYGVSEAQFNGMFNSFMVVGKITESKNLAKSYMLEGVPAITVNGKYVISGEGQDVIDSLNTLINKERGRKK